MAYIYKITNLINKKIYIGKTSFTIQKRWQEHKREVSKSNFKKRPLYAALLKYGFENFSIEVLEECSNELVNKREIFWIKKLGSYENGYNATLGGDGVLKGDHEEVFKLFESGANTRQIKEKTGYSLWHIVKILKLQGVSPKEISDRRADSLKKQVVKIDKYTDEVLEIFPSVTAAQKSLNKSSAWHITEVCQGKRKSAFGYKWEYYED